MTVLETEGRRSVRPSRSKSKAPSRQAGYTPVYKRRALNHPSDVNIVPTRLVAPVLERVIAEANADLGFDSDEDKGGLAVICERAGKTLGMSKETVVRRTYEIRRLKARASRASTADALLEAGNTSLRDEGIPEVPAGSVAAEDRIRCYLELTGGEMTEETILDLAEDLLEFSRCVIHGWGEEPAPEAADAVAVLEGELHDTVQEQLGLWEEAA